MRSCFFILGFLLLFGASIGKEDSDSVKNTEFTGHVEEGFIFLKRVENCEYFKGVNEATHTQAKQYCEAHFDGLLKIESPDDLPMIYDFMEDFGVDEYYWLDGLFLRNVGWIWSSGTPYPPNITTNPAWNPWGPGYPVDLETNSPAMNYHNEFDSPWVTKGSTEFLEYVCERCFPDTDPVPCYETNDLVIVLDSSGSITLPHYEIGLDFVAKLALAYGNHSDNRQGFVVFSDSATTIFDITNTLTNVEMDAIIRSTHYYGGGTDTASGIRMAMEMLLANQRPGVPMNMVVMTDGASNNPTATKEAAELAIDNDIRTFSVGITNGVNQQELSDIAGGRSDRVFFTEDFEELLNLLRPVSIRVCDN